MISEIRIKRFKCFQESKPYALSNLNLLTGINGRGKSTLLQSILILAQSVRRDGFLKKLLINGDLLQLGNYHDVKNSESSRSGNIEFHFKFDNSIPQETHIQFSDDEEEPLIGKRKSFSIYNKNRKGEIIKSRKEEDILHFSNILKRVHFVGADRMGPVSYVDKTVLPEFLNVGSRGEHTIGLLANSSNLPTVHKEMYLGNDSASLIQQTAEWLSFILGGAKIEISGRAAESSVLSVLMNNRGTSNVYKQANVGFGYSYIIPLIVTGLIAQKGDIIIIENPEAHLHPRAQSRIAAFFAKVASCGIQVFIESHSEHILNGLRVSALQPDINLKYNEIMVHYFDENFESTVLKMNSKGKIDNWPTGFFDQQEIDLADIFQLSR